MIIEYFYSHKSSPLHLITRSATVAAMAESVSIWSMRTPKTDSVGRVGACVTIPGNTCPSGPPSILSPHCVWATVCGVIRCWGDNVIGCSRWFQSSLPPGFVTLEIIVLSPNDFVQVKLILQCGYALDFVVCINQAVHTMATVGQISHDIPK